LNFFSTLYAFFAKIPQTFVLLTPTAHTVEQVIGYCIIYNSTFIHLMLGKSQYKGCVIVQYTLLQIWDLFPELPEFIGRD